MAYKKLLGALVAVVGSLALTACSTGGNCGSCAGPAVYKKPCCAQSGGSGGGGGYYAPAPKVMPAPTQQAPAAMACGTGKCG